ncbi:two component transcriptional regulator, LytTR family (plasmid) [Fibrisoma limi BUZ 3]|uniref:Two component transcriptional regulator, LytTR family n=1 Tax=Fibrisoma limi BUZ 3 TaxID=1185876 RepID=I2GTV4_9BACT|nr:LytTR family DNA-binding domain-containing protein [Fibrisoma limi]CCH57555.1 two component transcriptional regulator, LytTR family [Fibrisoma limi BUZ 3]
MTAHSIYPTTPKDPVVENQYLKEQLASAMKLISQLNTGESPQAKEHIYLYTERRLQKVSFKDINWIQSERNYVTIYTEHGYLTVHQPISRIEELLPQSSFSRIHKSFIVANDKIDFIGKDQVGLKSDQHTKILPLGAQYKKSFIQLFKQAPLKRNSLYT